MKYPAFKPGRTLKALKTGIYAADLRNGSGFPVSIEETMALRYCDGLHTQAEIMALVCHALGADTTVDWGRFDSVLEYHQEERPARDGSLRAFDAQLSLLKNAWPFYPLREPAIHKAVLTLTHMCNHRCTYCFQGEAHWADDRMDGDVWLDTLEQLHALGLQELTITGGEAILHPVFWRLLERAREMGLYVTLQTNGSLVGETEAERLHSLGVQYIYFSLPSLDEQVYDRVTRSKGDLRPAMQALALLKKQGLYMRVKAVLTPENGEDQDIRSLCRYCNDNGVEEVHLAPFMLTARGEQRHIPTVASLRRIDGLADALQDEYGDSMLISYPGESLYHWEPQHAGRCSGVKTHVDILPNGDVTFCAPIAKHGLFIFGNVRSNSLRDIWYSDAVDAVNHAGEYDATCGDCPKVNACRSGCMLFSYLDSGNLWGADPRCARSCSKLFRSAEEADP